MTNVTRKRRGRPRLEDVQGLRDRRIIPVIEREELERNIKLEEDYQKHGFSNEIGDSEVSRASKKILASSANANQEHGDRKANNNYLMRMKKALYQGEPDSLSKNEIARLEAEKKVLVEEVRKRMLPKVHAYLAPTYRDSGRKGIPNPDFNRAVRAMCNSEFTPGYLKIAHRLKNVLRQLSPNDPEAGNLEHIRPD